MAIPVKIYPSPALEAWLKNRQDRAGTTPCINALFDRYQALLDEAVPILTVGEWFSVFDAMNGVVTTDRADNARMLAAQVQAGYRDDREWGWGINIDALVYKLAAMPLAAQTAVLDVTERFWGLPQTARVTATEILDALGVPYE